MSSGSITEYRGKKKIKEIYYSLVGIEVHTSWGHVGRSRPRWVKTERDRAWGTYLY